MPALIAIPVGAALGAAGLTGAALATTTAVVSGTIFTAAVVGAQLLLTPRPSLPKPTDGSLTRQQPLPEAQYGFGRFRTGGARTFEVERDGQLYVAQALLEGKIQGYAGTFLNDDEVEVDGDGFVVRPVLEDLRDGRYTDRHVLLADRLGNDPETEYEILRDVFGSDLPANFRGDGIASTMMRLWSPEAQSYATIFPNGRPNLSRIIDSVRLWDFRSGSQDPDDPETWAGAGYDNPMLQLAYYEAFHPHGWQRGASAILNYLPYWATAADVCDLGREVAAGGTIPLFRSGFSWSAGMDRAEVRRVLLAACNGQLWEMPDGLVPYAGRYSAPEVTLTADDIIAVNIQRGIPGKNVVNEMTIKFTSPAHAWGEADARSWLNQASIAKLGERRARSADLWQIHDYRRARWVAWLMMQQLNPAYSGELICNLGGLRARGRRWVGVADARLSMLPEPVIEVSDAVRLDPETLTVRVPFRSSGSFINAWNPSMEGPPPPMPTFSRVRQLPVPVILSAVAQQASVSSGKPGVYLAVRLAEPAGGRKDLAYSIRYKPKSAAAGRWRIEDFNEPDIAGGVITLTTELVEAESRYLVEPASRSTRGTRSAWGDTVEVDTSLDETAPASSTGLAVEVSGDDAALTWTASISDNYKADRIYRSTTALFADAVQIGGRRLGEPGESMNYTDDGLPPGTYTYWVRSENFSGVQSAEAGPVTASIS